MHVYLGTNQIANQSIFFNFKSPLLYIWCIFVTILFYECFLQIENLNLATNLEFFCYYVVLIACKCMPLCKRLNCDTKSEPPYFATTLLCKLMYSLHNPKITLHI
jgi:hypothetical protein